MARLEGKVAVVTGASRGLGKGIALGLGEAGATVYVTGRSTAQQPGELPGTIDETADGVRRLGGRGVAVTCDHRNDNEVEALFERVRRDEGRLDVLINNAMASPSQSVLWGGQRFWEMPISLWDDLIDVGLRSHFVASRFAAPLLIEQGEGMIINVASHGSVNGKDSSMSNALIAYSVGKAGLHRLTSDMAVELRDAGVAVIAIWPPGTRTEGVLAQAEIFGDLSRWREPIFTGRVVAALLATRNGLDSTGQALVITELASELGISP
jgi:NAD(P)-dependent dehydrogenase (short-subunit alcohol dehydrogenase family)